MAAIAEEIGPHLAPGATVTDVGSVKQAVIAAVAPHLPENVHFIPGHPMAGTEYSGPRSGFATLFQNRWWLLTPSETTDTAALDRLRDYLTKMGARVDTMDAEHHDLVLAVVSHTPHLIAYTMVGVADHLAQVSNSEVIQYSATGFRDFTRIAASDPTMWRDVFLTNKDAVLDVLGRFTEELFALQRAIRMGDGDLLHAYFTRTRAIRRGIIEAGQDTSAPDFGRVARQTCRKLRMRRGLWTLVILPLTASIALAEAPVTTMRPAPRPPVVVPEHPTKSIPYPPHAAPTRSVAPKPAAKPIPAVSGKSQPVSAKGSVCNNPRIKGVQLKPLVSRVKGCIVKEPVMVTSINGVRFAPAVTINCDEAAAFAVWIDQGLQPAFNNQVVQLNIFDSYSCRPTNNVRGAKVSEHGLGNAVDISGFVLKNGKTLTVARNYNSQIRAAQKAACGPFHTTLGPGSDGYHENHIHLDVAHTGAIPTATRLVQHWGRAQRQGPETHPPIGQGQRQGQHMSHPHPTSPMPPARAQWCRPSQAGSSRRRQTASAQPASSRPAPLSCLQRTPSRPGRSYPQQTVSTPPNWHGNRSG